VITGFVLGVAWCVSLLIAFQIGKETEQVKSNKGDNNE
jgi:hypothetical protein